MALSAGRRLGPYEILEPLGAGGMGEVYRARDTRLKREVALKVLPAELASEPERLERFQREAETLAALNHPHIVTIFSVEEAEEHRFLTMELVEGKTLARVIPRSGLPLSRLFQIAIPLAEAVSAAHEKGITHRDLKPGNVMVTEEGRVKVLDFGLAKLREGVRGEVDTQSPTEPATGPGRILGTAPYMSPEQVQGKTLDHRSDVFALGIMLYEMATGERPFGGDTFADVASSILKDNPVSVTERKADLPRDLGKLIKHCLEKEPRKRFQSTLDLANELEELRREVGSGEALTSGGAPVVTSRAGSKRRIWLVGGAAAAALALAVGSLLLRRNAQPAAPLEITPFTSDGGYKSWPSFSPDAEEVAYEWAGPDDDNWDIYVKALGVGTTPLRLTQHSANDSRPVWSPDGRQIAFVRWTDDEAALYTVPSLGGQERKLIDIGGRVNYEGDASFIVGLSWSPDGEWLAYSEKPDRDAPAPVVLLSLSTLERRMLTSPPEDAFADLHPSFSPDGRHLAFFRLTGTAAGSWDLWVQPLDGGEARRVTSEDFSNCRTLVWTPDGLEIIVNCYPGGISRVGLAGGRPRHVAGIGQDAARPSVRGDRMVYAQRIRSGSGDLWRVPGRTSSLEKRPPERLIASTQADLAPDYSPDGRRIAFASKRSDLSFEIWLSDADGSNPIQLTHFERSAGAPRWSPDGREILFNSPEAGDLNIYVIDAEGGIPRQLTREPSADITPSWSRDGRWIYFGSDRSGPKQVWRMPAEGGTASQVTRGGGFFGLESWDRRHLYYTKEPPSGVWRVPVEGGEETEILPGPIYYFWEWALSRNGIYFATSRWLVPWRVSEYTIAYLDLDSGEIHELFTEEAAAGHASLAVSPDEQWVLFGRAPLEQSELMLVENFR